MDFAIDTNVAVVANGHATHVVDSCVEASIDFLQDCIARGRVLLDETGFVFEEYTKHLRRSGEPGVGDAFLRWLWDHQAVAQHCRLLDIQPVDTSGENFACFPNDSALANFDRSDRKFVALVVAANTQAQVVNAADSDWRQHASDLLRHGVRVLELCP